MGCEVLHVVFLICRGYLEDLNSPTGVIFDEGGELFLNMWTGVHFTRDRIVRQAGQDLRQLGTGSLTGADQNECRGGHQGGLARAGSLSDLTDLRSRMTLSTHAFVISRPAKVDQCVSTERTSGGNGRALEITAYFGALWLWRYFLVPTIDSEFRINLTCVQQ